MLRAVREDEDSKVLRRRINENSNLTDRKFNEVSSVLTSLKDEITKLKGEIVTLRNANETLKIQTQTTTKKALHAKFIKLGESSLNTMVEHGLFVDINDDELKFKKKNGEVKDVS